MNHTTTYPHQSPRPANGSYRYFFNGQEADNEVLGEGAFIGYEFRQYDTRLGRWWGIDRKAAKYPSLSPYQFCADNPIKLVDIDGSDFVVVIDNSGDNKTITIQMSIYTASQEAFEKLLPAVNEINEITKIVTIDGVEYTLCFAINPVTPDPTIYHNYQSNMLPDELLRTNALDQADCAEYLGNAFLGSAPTANNGTMLSSGIIEIKGGYTSNGKYSYMDAWKGTCFIDYPKLIAHEILHMLGLDDEGGYYYSPGGRMEYTATSRNSFFMNPISNDDIRNIVRYMLDYDGFDVENGANVRIEYLNNSTPIQSHSNIEVK